MLKNVWAREQKLLWHLCRHLYVRIVPERIWRLNHPYAQHAVLSLTAGKGKTTTVENVSMLPGGLKWLDRRECTATCLWLRYIV